MGFNNQRSYKELEHNTMPHGYIVPRIDRYVAGKN